MGTVSDFTTILEGYCLASHNIEVDRIHVHAWREAGVARPAVQLLGPLMANEWDRWMMTNLLKVEIRSIGKSTL